jgi:hypothetical protein
MNPCLDSRLPFRIAALSLAGFTGCALAPTKRVASTAPAKAAVATKSSGHESRDRKPTSAAAPFLVEAFRCSMQVGANLNAGIRVYSSLDGKENSLIYGPERMDGAPVANDSFLYNGVTAVLSVNADGKTVYSFQHPKVALQILVPRGSPETAVFEAGFSEESGATGLKGLCNRVSPVVY